MECTSSYVVTTSKEDPDFEYPHYILYLWTETGSDKKVFAYKCTQRLWSPQDDTTCDLSVDKEKQQICLTSVDRMKTIIIFERKQVDWKVYTREPNEKRGYYLGILRNSRLSTLLDGIIA